MFKRFLFIVAFLCALPLMFAGHWLAALAFLGITEALLGFAYKPGYSFVNSLGTLSSSLIIQEALALVYTKRPFLRSVSLSLRSLDGRVEMLNKGQAAVTRLKAIPTVGNFGDAAQANADVDVSITLSDFKQILKSYTAAELNSTDRDLIRESAEPMAISIGNYLMDTVAALWTAGNFPARTGADAVANGVTQCYTVKAAGWDYTFLTTLRAKLNKAGVPEGGRFFVGNSDVYASLLTDMRVVAALNNPDNAGAIKSGRLPNVAGFDMMEYPALPTTGNMVAVAGTADSTAVAVRPPKDPSESLPNAPKVFASGYATDPGSGFTVAIDEWIATDRSANVRAAFLGGQGVGNPNNLERVTTQ